MTELAGNPKDSKKLPLSKELITALRRGDTQAIQTALDAKANINASDPQSGMTLLHYTVLHRRIDATKLLLKKGANIHALNKDGETPWLNAAINLLTVAKSNIKDSQFRKKIENAERAIISTRVKARSACFYEKIIPDTAAALDTINKGIESSCIVLVIQELDGYISQLLKSKVEEQIAIGKELQENLQEPRTLFTEIESIRSSSPQTQQPFEKGGRSPPLTPIASPFSLTSSESGSTISSQSEREDLAPAAGLLSLSDAGESHSEIEVPSPSSSSSAKPA